MFKRSLKYLLALLNLQVSRIKVVEVPGETGPQEWAKHVGNLIWFKHYNIATVIDIGANEGQFAAKIQAIFPNAQIHCFEPLPEVFQLLKLNYQNRSNVTVYNFALGETNEEKEIFSNEYSPSSSLLEMMNIHKENFDFALKVEPKRITIRKLNDFFPVNIKQPLLIKIDVQGYEMYVLKGGENVVSQADIIIIEASFIPMYKGQPLFDEIYSYFVSKGFRYAGNVEELVSPVDGKVLQVDAIFMGKSFVAAQNAD